MVNRLGICAESLVPSRVDGGSKQSFGPSATFPGVQQPSTREPAAERTELTDVGTGEGSGDPQTGRLKMSRSRLKAQRIGYSDSHRQMHSSYFDCYGSLGFGRF